MTIGEGHFEFHLAGEGVVKAAPGVKAVDVEIGGQGFHFGFHLVLALVAHALHGVLGIFQRGIEEQHLERGIAQSGQGRAQGCHELGAFCFEGGDPCLVCFYGFVICIVGGQAAEVGGEMAEAVAERFERGDYVGGVQGVATEGCCLGLERLDIADEGTFEIGVVGGAEGGEPGFEGPAVGGGGRDDCDGIGHRMMR